MNLHPKVASVGMAGAASVVLVWILHQFVHIEIPAEVASAITVIIGFIAGWSASSGAD